MATGASGSKVQPKSDSLIDSIKTGPYHCCYLSNNNELYSWGYDRMCSTGIPMKINIEDKKNESVFITGKPRFINAPKPVVYLAKFFEENKINQTNLIRANNLQNFESRKEESKIIEEDPDEEEESRFSEQIPGEDEEEKIDTRKQNTAQTHLKSGREFNDEHNLMLSQSNNIINYKKDIEEPFKFLDKRAYLYLNPENQAFSSIHEYLVNEKRNKCDELSAIKLRNKLCKYLDQIIKYITQCSEVKEKRKQYELRIESLFISRLSYDPFEMDKINYEHKKGNTDLAFILKSEDKVAKVRECMTA